MSLGEIGIPGAVPRVAVAVTRGDEPVVVMASDGDVLTRAVALEIVAKTRPSSIGKGAVDGIRDALLEERWVDAILQWMSATGEVVDAYPDEPVWHARHLDDERVALELRMAPIFSD